MELLPYLFVAALSFFLGGIFGANRTFRLVMQGRAMRRSHARIARFLPDAPPSRTVADIFANRVRLQFGGMVYDVPVLPRAAERKWLANLDTNFAAVAMAIDEGSTGEAIAVLANQPDLMLDALYEYDTSGVLPPRDELDELASTSEILYAVLEVWRAANPLVVSVLNETSPPTSGSSPEPPSSSPQPTAGEPTTSTAFSPPSSSSPTSMPPKSGSSMTPPTALRSLSKPSESDTSSPATGRHIADGRGAPAAPQRPAGAEG